MEIRPLHPADHVEAARLVASRYRQTRPAIPALPPRWSEPEAYLAQLSRIDERGAGVAMLDGGRLVGFLGSLDEDWGDGRLTWTPEWAWGTTRLRGHDRRAVIQDLYGAAAERSVAAGRLTHLVTVLADDRSALDALGWLGFGHFVVDALRDLSPVERRPEVGVRHALEGDATVLGELEDGLRAHLQSSPAFLRLPPPRPLEEQRRRIADDGRAVLLAELGGRVVGHLLIGPVSDDVANVVRDPGTASITGAFVRAEHRRIGVAETLLSAAIGWARERGYARIAVDFESANLLASRFWTRHFRPVAYTVVRRLRP